MSYCENIQSILADEVVMMELIIGLETQLSKFLLVEPKIIEISET